MSSQDSSRQTPVLNLYFKTLEAETFYIEVFSDAEAREKSGQDIVWLKKNLFVSMAFRAIGAGLMRFRQRLEREGVSINLSPVFSFSPGLGLQNFFSEFPLGLACPTLAEVVNRIPEQNRERILDALKKTDLCLDQGDSTEPFFSKALLSLIFGEEIAEKLKSRTKAEVKAYLERRAEELLADPSYMPIIQVCELKDMTSILRGVNDPLHVIFQRPCSFRLSFNSVSIDPYSEEFNSARDPQQWVKNHVRSQAIVSEIAHAFSKSGDRLKSPKNISEDSVEKSASRCAVCISLPNYFDIKALLGLPESISVDSTVQTVLTRCGFEEAIEAGKPSIGRQKTSDIAKRLREAANSLMYLDRASCPAARRTLGAEPFLGTEDLAVLFGGAVESYRCPTVGEVLERVHARARQLNVSIQLFEENTEKMMSSLRPAGRYTVTCNFSPKPAPVVLFFNCPRFSIEMSSTPDERGYLGQDLEWLKKTALLKWVTAGWALLLKGANPSLDAYARAFCHWSFELFPFGLDLGTALGGDKVTSSHFNVDEILKRTLRIPGVDLELPGAEARTNREGFLLGVLIEQLPGAIETLERAVNSYISDRSSSDLNGPWLSPELLDILQLGGQVYSTSESSYDLFRTETPPTVRQVLDELMKRIDKVVVDPTVSIGVEFKKIGSDGMPTVSQDAIFKRPEKVVSPVPVSATATVLRPAQAVGATARVANSAGVSVGDALILNRSRAALFCSDHSGFNPWDKL